MSPLGARQLNLADLEQAVEAEGAGLGMGSRRPADQLGLGGRPSIRRSLLKSTRGRVVGAPSCIRS